MSQDEKFLCSIFKSFEILSNLDHVRTYIKYKNPIPKTFSTSDYELYVKDDTKERVMICVHFAVRWKMEHQVQNECETENGVENTENSVDNTENGANYAENGAENTENGANNTENDADNTENGIDSTKHNINDIY
ncbi:20245_t:CDS:2 [Gigaspora margarita]|uniref:20245_t:CDS:1 n=1 Tax=Gigaspora margarita TaxID=4874 RepID=A0ABM8VXB3_GIGMA|nr:20245_t:CDS:2 [Gigaspora margarita]